MERTTTTTKKNKREWERERAKIEKSKNNGDREPALKRKFAGVSHRFDFSFYLTRSLCFSFVFFFVFFLFLAEGGVTFGPPSIVIGRRFFWPFGWRGRDLWATVDCDWSFRRVTAVTERNSVKEKRKKNSVNRKLTLSTGRRRRRRRVRRRRTESEWPADWRPDHPDVRFLEINEKNVFN